MVLTRYMQLFIASCLLYCSVSFAITGQPFIPSAFAQNTTQDLSNANQSTLGKALHDINKTNPGDEKLARSIKNTMQLNTVPHTNRDNVSSFLLADKAIDVSQAASVARAKFGGKVLSITKEKQGDRVVFRVKLLLDEGRVKMVNVDAGSGKIVE